MNRKKLKQKLKKIFGFIFIYILIAFVGIRFYQHFKNMNKKHYYTLIADVKKTDGLEVNDKVRLSGLDVGIVSDMVIQPDYSINVFMKIDNNFSIPDDSSVAIYTEGLLGGKYVAILPGGSFDFFEDGGVFDYAQDAVNITEMIEIGVEQFSKKDEKEDE